MKILTKFVFAFIFFSFALGSSLNVFAAPLNHIRIQQATHEPCSPGTAKCVQTMEKGMMKYGKSHT
jgi:hypothetical protein